MRRRDVILLLGGATAAWPVLGHAQKVEPRPPDRSHRHSQLRWGQYTRVSEFRSELLAARPHRGSEA